MKRIIYLFVVVFAMQKVEAQQTQKIKVLDSISIKIYLDSKPQKIEDFNTKTAQYVESETQIFKYNKQGNLIYIKTKKEDGEFWIDIQRDNKETIVSIVRNEEFENKGTASLTYKDNLLQLLTEDDWFTKDSTLTYYAYEYNKSKLPNRLTKTSTDKDITPDVYLFEYSNNQIKTIDNNSVVTTYTYDTKKYPFSSQPNYWDISFNEPLVSLFMTNYVQKNNLTKVEDKYGIWTFIHTYNSSNLPVKTIAIVYYPKKGKYWPFFNEYQYHYREISIKE
ncbi:MULTISPECIES: hypothetical protein [unclassified Myroides]|uniref:hypothetical protein n=1 Tax=unclassified Myroides TaxID=2642485 RepID=UPI003D2F63BF